MKVSIVIPVYNAERYLDECILSALDQTYPHTEIIAVDDCSTDTSAEILKGYSDRIRVYSKPNGGTASALNLGVRHMSGGWFKWFNADDILKPLAVATLAGAARRLGWPDDHIFYARCDYINEHGKRAGRLASIEPNYNRRSDFERNAILLRRFYANGITSTFHRSVFGRCGPFDETLGYSEDYEFWLRCCLLHGCRLHLVPRSIAQCAYTSRRSPARTPASRRARTTRYGPRSCPGCRPACGRSTWRPRPRWRVAAAPARADWAVPQGRHSPSIRAACAGGCPVETGCALLHHGGGRR